MIPSAILVRIILWVTPVLAQGPCVGIPGDCSSAENVLARFIPAIGRVWVSAAAGLAVIGVIVGGGKMMLNFGDESKIQQGKQAIVYSLLGFIIVLASQSIVAFVAFRTVEARGDEPLFDFMTAVVGAMLSVFNVAFVLMIILAGYRMVVGYGQSDEFNKARTMVIWAIGGAIAVNAAHAVVRVLLNLGL